MTPPRRLVAIHQPETLPWLGFLDKLRRCDVFVLLDDVQFEKHYFQNRNRIRTPTPQGWSWLTIPVRIGGRFGQRIDRVEIDDATNWRRKHLAAIEQHYHRAPAFVRQWPALQARYAEAPARLAEFNIAMIRWMMDAVGLARPLLRSSELDVGGGRSARLLEICHRVEATEYLSGVSGRDYLDVAIFERAGIGVRFQEFRHPVYRQCYEPFVPEMSGLDLVLNCGEASADVLAGAGGAGGGDAMTPPPLGGSAVLPSQTAPMPRASTMSQSCGITVWHSPSHQRWDGHLQEVVG